MARLFGSGMIIFKSVQLFLYNANCVHTYTHIYVCTIRDVYKGIGMDSS